MSVSWNTWCLTVVDGAVGAQPCDTLYLRSLITLYSAYKKNIMCCYGRGISSSPHRHFWTSVVGNKGYCVPSSFCGRRWFNVFEAKYWKISLRLQCVLLSTVLTFLCYSNSIAGGFVHDDIEAIVRNPDVVGGSNRSWFELWRNDFWGQRMSDPDSHKSYRPLTVFTFRINHLFGGSCVFHFVNVIIHGFCVYHISRLVSELGFKSWTRVEHFLAIALFATYPVHTEAVASLVGRTELLYAFFFILGIRCFLRASREESECKKSAWFSGTVCCAVFSLLSKEQGITLLPLCILLQARHHWCTYLRCHSSQRHNLYYLFGRIFRDPYFILLSFVFFLLFSFRVWMLNGNVPSFSEHDNPAAFNPHVTTRFLTYCYLAVFNVRLMLFPMVLSYDWQMGSISLVESVLDWRNIQTLMIFAATYLLCKRILRTQSHDGNALFAAVLLVILPYLPASNLFVTVGFVVAERILYLPSLGFCLVVTHGFSQLRRVSKMFAFMERFIVVIVLATFMCRTISRNNAWHSRQTLFESGVRDLPTNAKLHYNFANLQKDLGNTQLAIEHYKIAIRLCPNHASAHNNLGTLFTGELESEKHFKAALAINPNHPGAHFNLGTLHMKRGDVSRAKVLLLRAIQLDSMFAEAYSTLANVLSLQGDTEHAEKMHSKALELDPGSADIRNNYGVYLQGQNRFEEAAEQYQTATELQPNHTAAVVNLARVLQVLKLDRQAEALYKRAIVLERGSSVLDSLALLCVRLGRVEEARALYQTTLQEFPRDTQIRLHYAQLLVQIRLYHEAEEVLAEVLVENATHQEGLRQTALLYSITNRTKNAKELMEKALSQCENEKQCAPLHSEYADILKDLKMFNESANAYRKALNLDPSMAHAHLNLGVIYHVTGRYNDALHHYTIAQALDPQNVLVSENLEKLKHHDRSAHLQSLLTKSTR